jgi:hypothetical protein
LAIDDLTRNNKAFHAVEEYLAAEPDYFRVGYVGHIDGGDTCFACSKKRGFAETLTS